MNDFGWNLEMQSARNWQGTMKTPLPCIKHRLWLVVKDFNYRPMKEKVAADVPFILRLFCHKNFVRTKQDKTACLLFHLKNMEEARAGVSFKYSFLDESLINFKSRKKDGSV